MKKPPVIGKKINEMGIDALLKAIDPLLDDDASFFVGYPVVATGDDPITIPALLISPKIGLVAFDIAGRQEDLLPEHLARRSDEIKLALKLKLLRHRELVSGAELSFPLNVVCFSPNWNPQDLLAHNVATEATLAAVLEKCAPFPEVLTPYINAAIERVANLKPKAKRTNVSKLSSRGSVLRNIESQIANLDAWQKSAAIELPSGPQRIRGLAGSGKTIVLALKASYLHGQNPKWNIAVTFHTRALKQQFVSLITRFYREDYSDDPDFDNLKVVHSFGSQSEPGIYSILCEYYKIPPRDFSYAKHTYGYGAAFQGICRELLDIVEANPLPPIFDAILIDEAQDMPSEFLKLAFYAAKDHRLVWAYDDLQNLGDYQLQSLKATFGTNQNGDPKVSLVNERNQPRQEIILPRCYRNTPWALVAAHALGSGIYRQENKIIQHPDDPTLWTDIGYEVDSGDLEYGKLVVLKRRSDATPQFFSEYITPDDAIQLTSFATDQEQLVACANAIEQNITQDELYPHDIVVVFPDALKAARRGSLLQRHLLDRGIRSHVAGVTTSRDSFLIEGSVAISGPYRAKGNEAPMVYLLDAEFCAAGFELIKRRNILFTAITRSRAWIRVYGVGSMMNVLIDEFNRLKEHEYKLRFVVPTAEEMKQIRTQYRDFSETEKKQVNKLQNQLEDIFSKQGDAAALIQSLPKEIREQLLKSLNPDAPQG